MPAVELILARNLLAQLSTPGFLVDDQGQLVFYNDAAGSMLGIRYEEAGAMGPYEWGIRFAPRDEQGRLVPMEELPLSLAFQSGRPAHSRLQVRSEVGDERQIEVTAFPIHGSGGRRGAIAIFWPAGD